MSHSGLSGLIELDRLILLDLTLRESQALLETSREYHQISKDEVYWRMRLEQDYPGSSKFKPNDLTWMEHYQKFHISHKLHNPAEAGYFPVLDWMVERGVKPNLFLVYYPDETLALRLMEWLIQHGDSLHSNHLLDAAYHGHPKVLEWLEEHEMLPDSDVADQAIHTGQLKVLKWLAGKGIFPARGADTAVEEGHLEVLKWMDEEYNILPSAGSARMAFSLKVSKWLEEKGIPPSQDNANTAACGGSLEILEWLETRGILPEPSAIVWAAKHKHFEIVKWAVQKGIQITDIDNLTGRGCLEMLEYLYQELKILPTSKGADAAAMEGSLYILEWLEKRGILPTAKGADMAVATGRVSVLKWLFNRRIFPTETGLNKAVMFGRPEILELLKENGMDPGDKSAEVMRDVYENRLVFS